MLRQRGSTDGVQDSAWASYLAGSLFSNKTLYYHDASISPTRVYKGISEYKWVPISCQAKLTKVNALG